MATRAEGPPSPPFGAAGASRGTRRAEIARWVSLWLLGVDLRVTVLALAPVLPEVARELHLDHAAVGAITNLPVLLFGLGAALGSIMIGRLGTRRAILLGLAFEAVAGALRGVGPSVAILFGCTFLMGLGIAVFQPALPALVRQWRPGAVGAATAVYGNGLLIGETLGASLTLPVVLRLTGGWQGALAAWSVPVVLTVLLVALTRTWHRPNGPEHRAGGPAAGDLAGLGAGTSEREATRMASWPDFRELRTWQLGLVQGGASTVYFGANTFLPGFLHATGHGSLVGPALTVLNLSQLPASALLFLHADRLARQRWPLPLVASSLIGVSVGLLVASGPIVLVLAGILGFSTAFMLLLTLALPAASAAAGQVASVSAGMFTIGYSLAFVLPLLGGFAADATGSVRVTLVPAFVGAAVATIASATLRPGRPAGELGLRPEAVPR